MGSSQLSQLSIEKSKISPLVSPYSTKEYSLIDIMKNCHSTPKKRTVTEFNTQKYTNKIEYKHHKMLHLRSIKCTVIAHISALHHLSIHSQNNQSLPGDLLSDNWSIVSGDLLSDNQGIAYIYLVIHCQTRHCICLSGDPLSDKALPVSLVFHCQTRYCLCLPGDPLSDNQGIAYAYLVICCQTRHCLCLCLVFHCQTRHCLCLCLVHCQTRHCLCLSGDPLSDKALPMSPPGAPLSDKALPMSLPGAPLSNY